MAQTAPVPVGRARLLERVFSLSGVVPLGVFLVLHLATNSRVLRGDAAFARAVDLIHRIPLLQALEALFVFAPLLFHTAFGLWLVVGRRPLSEPSPYPRAVSVAVRATGVVVVAFLALHLPELRFRTSGARLDGGALATMLAADLSSTSRGMPWRGVAYLLGTACVSFHFAAGLWGFFATTHNGRGAVARKRAAWWAGAVGAVTWILFANVVLFHATGARLFGGAPVDATSPEPCPPASAGGP